MDYFGFSLDEDVMENPNVSMNFWLIEKDDSSENLVEMEVSKFENWAAAGGSKMNIELSNGMKFRAVSLSRWEDINCQSIETTVLSASKGSKSTSSANFLVLMIAFMVYTECFFHVASKLNFIRLNCNFSQF